MIHPGPLSPADASYLNEQLRDLDVLRRQIQSLLGQADELIPAAITGTTSTSATSGQHGWTEEDFGANGTRTSAIGGRSGLNVVDVARLPDGGSIAVTPTSAVHCWIRKTGLASGSGMNHEILGVAGGLGFARFALATTLATADTSMTSCTVDGYWGGVAPGTRITVHNLPASTAFIFSGTSQAKGLAAYDPSTGKWWIVQLQC